MLILQITTTNYPFIKDTDEIVLALQLMEQNDVQHLPVLDNDKKYLGLVAKNDLLQTKPTDLINSLKDKWIGLSLHFQDHFLSALKIMMLHDLSIIAVVNDQKEWQGVVTKYSLITACGKFMGVDLPGGIITVEIDKKNLSLSEIARLVETNDAYITQLNTQHNPETGSVTVCIRINRMEIAAILATFQRYDYIIKSYSGEQYFENELKENYDLLMAYLNI